MILIALPSQGFDPAEAASYHFVAHFRKIRLAAKQVFLDIAPYLKANPSSAYCQQLAPMFSKSFSHSGLFRSKYGIGEQVMKYFLVTCFIGALVTTQTTAADCIKNQYGNVVCGKGECETDTDEKIYCANPGGGAIKDLYGKVQCGVGYCAKDSLGQVWCSKMPGGGAAVDSFGKVKCLGGCEAASSTLCVEAQ